MALRTLVTVAVGSALGLRGVKEASAVTCSPNGSRCLICDPPAALATVHAKGDIQFLRRRAPSQGVCTINDDTCNGTGKDCGHGKGRGTCSCFRDMFGASFCGIGPLVCNDCTSNKDCPKGHRCFPTGSGGCCAGHSARTPPPPELAAAVGSCRADRWVCSSDRYSCEPWPGCFVWNWSGRRRRGDPRSSGLHRSRAGCSSGVDESSWAGCARSLCTKVWRQNPLLNN